MASGNAGVIIVLAVTMLLITSTAAMETKIDPETQRIRTLLGGLPSQGVGWGGWPVTFLYVIDDPRFDVRAPLPHLGLDTPLVDLVHSQKMSRIYLPRSYESFLENTDLVILANIDVRVFPPQVIKWMRDGVLEEGLGLTMTGGSQGFGGYGGFPSWGDTFIGPILPVECFPGEHSKTYTPKLRVVAPENELGRSLPWDDAPCFFPYNFIEMKPGSTVIIESKDEKREPTHFYWDIQEGRVVGCQNIFGVFGCNFMEWEYFQDSVLNVYYYSAALPIPEDLYVIHEIRRKWHEYGLERKLLVSMIEFADKFNANLANVENQIEDLNEIKKTADRLYLAQEYPEALQRIEEAMVESARLSALTVDAKNLALFWIYIIEWLTVLGTLMITGTITWTLMVRRAAFKEVRATRST